MADPIVDYTATPEIGDPPLTVTIVVIEVIIGTDELDPFSMAHGGFFNQTDQVFDPFQAAHGGFFISSPTVDFLWKFGDGQISTAINPGEHTYISPGVYILKLCLTVDGVLYEFPTTITVNSIFRGDYGVLGIGQNNVFRVSLNYGNDETQGLNWSTNSGDGHLWPDSTGSILSIFNESGEHEQLLFDSLTGIPFIFDTRKYGTSSLIKEVFKDKVNPKVSGSGTEITTRVRIGEYIGSHEHYYQKMSDINIYFDPMYRRNQGAIGYDEKGLRDEFIVGLELYADEKLEKVARAIKVPMDRELFFDRAIEGHILQIAFQTEASEYRMVRIESYLTNYDRARWTSKPQMTEKDFQDKASRLELWYTRSDTPTRDLIIGKEMDTTGANIITVFNAPDDFFESSFNVLDANISVVSKAKVMTYWTDVEDSIVLDTSFESETFDTFVVKTKGFPDVTWYYIKVKVITFQPVITWTLPKDTFYFDLRFYDEIILSVEDLTDEELRYQFNDITENNGNVICPPWFN